MRYHFLSNQEDLSKTRAMVLRVKRMTCFIPFMFVSDPQLSSPTWVKRWMKLPAVNCRIFWRRRIKAQQRSPMT